MAGTGAGCRWNGKGPRGASARCAVAIAFVAIAGRSPVATAQLPCHYEVAAVIKAPDGPSSDSPTYPMAISPNGQYIVGYFVHDGVAQARGWYYEMPDGPFTALPHTPTMITSRAYDVNDAGQICGYVGGTSGDRAFVFDISTQQYTLFVHPLYPGTAWAAGINQKGEICGARVTARNNRLTSFIWTATTGIQDIGEIDGMNNGFMSINDGGAVAGWRGSHQLASNARAICGSPGSLQILPPIPDGISSTATAINEAGTVCGFGRTPSPFGGFDDRAFVMEGSVISLLGVLPGYRRSYAFKIADNGVIGGQCNTLESNGAYAARAFLWHSGLMHDITSMIEAPMGELVEFLSVGGIADNGRLVGWGYANGINDAALVLESVWPTADLDHDCAVNINDLLIVVNAWGSTESGADADGDGFVDINDLLMVLNNWTL